MSSRVKVGFVRISSVGSLPAVGKMVDAGGCAGYFATDLSERRRSVVPVQPRKIVHAVLDFSTPAYGSTCKAI